MVERSLCMREARGSIPLTSNRHNFSLGNVRRGEAWIDAMAERLRRWITNPLGFPAWVQIPLASTFFLRNQQKRFPSKVSDTMAEWLRRQTRNLLGFPRVSSNLTAVVFCGRNKTVPAGDRTQNLLLRRQAPYPFGHRDNNRNFLDSLKWRNSEIG